jgi:hypothetical protein
MRRNYQSGRGNRSRDSYGRFSDSDRNQNEYNAYKNRGRGHGGWFGASDEHAEAAQRGWENRRDGSDRNYDYDEDREYTGGRGQGHGGWFDNSREHSEAAERGWQDRRGGAGRSYNEDYDYDYNGEGQGWHGDPEGHAEAAERGWQHRRGGSRRGTSMNRNYRGSSRGSSYSSTRGSSRRGFASMDPEEQREIASMGGRAAHEYGTAHEWNSREAARAGHLGGMARRGSRSRRRSYQD